MSEGFALVDFRRRFLFGRFSSNSRRRLVVVASAVERSACSLQQSDWVSGSYCQLLQVECCRFYVLIGRSAWGTLREYRGREHSSYIIRQGAMSVDPDKLYLIRSKVCIAQSAYTSERLPLRVLLCWCTGITCRSYRNAQLILAS